MQISTCIVDFLGIGEQLWSRHATPLHRCPTVLEHVLDANTGEGTVRSNSCGLGACFDQTQTRPWNLMEHHDHKSLMDVPSRSE